MTAFHSSNRRIDNDIKVLVRRKICRTNFAIICHTPFQIPFNLPNHTSYASPIISDFFQLEIDTHMHPTRVQVHQLNPQMQ